MKQASLFEGKDLRDQGLATVTDHGKSWMEAAIAAVLATNEFRGRAFLAEELRPIVVATAGLPHHPNAWGALTRILVLRKVITPTGEWRMAKSAKSHASRYPVYRS